MSRRTIFLLAGLYFVAAVAFSVFHVATNPFSSGLNTAAIGKGVGGALLLFGGAGLLPILGWALYSSLSMRCGQYCRGLFSALRLLIFLK